MRTTSNNTDTRILPDGFSIEAGSANRRKVTISGGNAAFIGGNSTYTLPAEDASLGILNQWDSGAITATLAAPYVVEIPITLRAPYRFPAVQVLRFISDELDGRWRLASQGIDYNIEFFGNDTMRIELYGSGSYKVNY